MVNQHEEKPIQIQPENTPAAGLNEPSFIASTTEESDVPVFKNATNLPNTTFDELTDIYQRAMQTMGDSHFSLTVPPGTTVVLEDIKESNAQMRVFRDTPEEIRVNIGTELFQNLEPEFYEHAFIHETLHIFSNEMLRYADEETNLRDIQVDLADSPTSISAYKILAEGVAEMYTMRITDTPETPTSYGNEVELAGKLETILGELDIAAIIETFPEDLRDDALPDHLQHEAGVPGSVLLEHIFFNGMNEVTLEIVNQGIEKLQDDELADAQHVIETSSPPTTSEQIEASGVAWFSAATLLENQSAIAFDPAHEEHLARVINNISPENIAALSTNEITDHQKSEVIKQALYDAISTKDKKTLERLDLP